MLIFWGLRGQTSTKGVGTKPQPFGVRPLLEIQVFCFTYCFTSRMTSFLSQTTFQPKNIPKVYVLAKFRSSFLGLVDRWLVSQTFFQVGSQKTSNLSTTKNRMKQPKKKLITFHYTGCLIGIPKFAMIFFSPLETKGSIKQTPTKNPQTTQGFLHCSHDV